MENGAGGGGSTPYSGTIQDLTLDLFIILADQHLSANALSWILASIRGLGTVFRTSGLAAVVSMVLGIWLFIF